MNIALDKVVRLFLIRIGQKLEVKDFFVRTFFAMVTNKSNLN